MLDLEPGDVLLLASGVRDTGLGDAEIVVVATPAARWRWHSRAAMAVVHVR